MYDFILFGLISLETKQDFDWFIYSYCYIYIQGEVEREEDSPYKRKCRSWAFECLELEENRSSCREEGDRTLELFPLHPEGRWRGLKNFSFIINFVSLWWSALICAFLSLFLSLFRERRKTSCLFVLYFWLGTKALCHSLFDLSGGGVCVGVSCVILLTIRKLVEIKLLG